MTDPEPFLARAASFLRTTPEPGWDAISDRVLSAVRATPRPGWPLRAVRAPGDVAAGEVYVSDHALRSMLARELRRRYVCRPTAINFTFADQILRGADIDITGSYGTELHPLGDQIRQTVTDIVLDVLGTDDTDPRPPIDVTITDVVTGDPLHPSDPAVDREPLQE